MVILTTFNFWNIPYDLISSQLNHQAYLTLKIQLCGQILVGNTFFSEFIIKNLNKGSFINVNVKHSLTFISIPPDSKKVSNMEMDREVQWASLT